MRRIIAGDRLPQRVVAETSAKPLHEGKRVGVRGIQNNGEIPSRPSVKKPGCSRSSGWLATVTVWLCSMPNALFPAKDQLIQVRLTHLLGLVSVTQAFGGG